MSERNAHKKNKKRNIARTVFNFVAAGLFIAAYAKTVEMIAMKPLILMDDAEQRKAAIAFCVAVGTIGGLAVATLGSSAPFGSLALGGLTIAAGACAGLFGGFKFADKVAPRPEKPAP